MSYRWNNVFVWSRLCACVCLCVVGCICNNHFPPSYFQYKFDLEFCRPVVFHRVVTWHVRVREHVTQLIFKIFKFHIVLSYNRFRTPYHDHMNSAGSLAYILQVADFSRFSRSRLPSSVSSISGPRARGGRCPSTHVARFLGDNMQFLQYSSKYI